MPTFRALTNYADGIPGATDRLLFETGGNAPRGIAPGSGNGLDADTVDGVEAAAFLQNIVEDTTPQLGGNLNGQDNEIASTQVRDIADVRPSASVNGAVTRDFSTGHVHELTLTGDVTSLTISNPPPSGQGGFIVFILIQDATGSRSWAHPSGITWPGGTAPTLTSTANGIDVISYMTTDGGSTWLGFEGGLDFQ